MKCMYWSTCRSVDLPAELTTNVVVENTDKDWPVWMGNNGTYDQSPSVVSELYRFITEHPPAHPSWHASGYDLDPDIALFNHVDESRIRPLEEAWSEFIQSEWNGRWSNFFQQPVCWVQFCGLYSI